MNKEILYYLAGAALVSIATILVSDNPFIFIGALVLYSLLFKQFYNRL